jgi:hypothetical protein
LPVGFVKASHHLRRRVNRVVLLQQRVGTREHRMRNTAIVVSVERVDPPGSTNTFANEGAVAGVAFRSGIRQGTQITKVTTHMTVPNKLPPKVWDDLSLAWPCARWRQLLPHRSGNFAACFNSGPDLCSRIFDLANWKTAYESWAIYGQYVNIFGGQEAKNPSVPRDHGLRP